MGINELSICQAPMRAWHTVGAKYAPAVALTVLSLQKRGQSAFAGVRVTRGGASGHVSG